MNGFWMRAEPGTQPIARAIVRNSRPAEESGPEGGQILILFVFCLFAIIGMVGLILDAGGAFAQRRGEQSAVDLAAMAGANQYLLNNDSQAATRAATTIASANGYTDGVAGTRVTVTLGSSPQAGVSVAISAPHPNAFSALFGMSSWTIAVQARATSSIPDTAIDPAPFVFSGDLFDAAGQPQAAYTRTGCGSTGCAWSASSTLPTGTTFSESDFGTDPSVNPGLINGLIDGSASLSPTIARGASIGVTNPAAASLTLIAAQMSGRTYPVAIVEAGSSHFLGWASFVVLGADNASGQLRGYFLDGVAGARFSASGRCTSGCPRYLGTFLLGLVE